MIDFDKTCAVCGGMVADYGPEHGWMHIVSQYDNTPHDVVLSDEPEVGSPQDKIGTERQDHLPECDLSKPCDNGKPHDMNNSGWNRCYRCEAGCICDRLRACESRIRSGYADTYTEGIAAGLDAAREAVVVLCWRKQYEGFVSTVDPQRVLAAIDALKEGK